MFLTFIFKLPHNKTNKYYGKFIYSQPLTYDIKPLVLYALNEYCKIKGHKLIENVHIGILSVSKEEEEEDITADQFNDNTECFDLYFNDYDNQMFVHQTEIDVIPAIP